METCNTNTCGIVSNVNNEVEFTHKLSISGVLRLTIQKVSEIFLVISDEELDNPTRISPPSWQMDFTHKLPIFGVLRWIVKKRVKFS